MVIIIGVIMFIVAEVIDYVGLGIDVVGAIVA